MTTSIITDMKIIIPMTEVIIKMKIKRIICSLSAIMLAAAAMTACSDSAGEADSAAQTDAPTAQTTANTDAPAPVAEEASADLSLNAEQVAENLAMGIEYVDSLNPISGDMIEKVYGISADQYNYGVVYVGGVSTAEEIACFDAVDETAAAEIKAACESRIAAQIKSVESYNPAELDKLNDPVIVTRGNSVYMCLSNDNDTARSIIG